MSQRLMLLVVVAAVSARADYSYLQFKMINNSTNPFPYYVDNRNSMPAGLAANGVKAAVERAWSTWNAVVCASPKAVSRGFSSGTVPRPGDPFDTFSVTPVWLTQLSDPDYIYVFGGGSGAVASMSLPLSYAGVLQTCDTFFNATNLAWSLDEVTPASTQDVETLMLHEAGHCLGLDHLGPENNIMFPLVPVGASRRVLGPDDTAALCARNPVSGAPGSPCDGDGGCGVNPTLKCMTQPATNGLTLKLCSNGCTTGTNANCTDPLSCQASAAFPGFNGACLLPGTQVTQVGKACTDASECGSSLAVCNPPTSAPSGGQFWTAGYCTQSCDVGQPPCPAGSTCVPIDGKNQCLQTCRVGLADCRPGYACLDDGSGSAGFCASQCGADVDCANQQQFFCRTCEGICYSRNNVSGQIGDGCSTESNCGPAQVCKTTASYSTVKTCTQQCARGCGACPSGSSCTPLANGDLYCLRSCTGPGTCPAGLRCADTASGKGCLPACVNDGHCPTGEHCFLGECYPPETDAGCTTLCQKPDSGVPINPSKDAGTGRPGGIGGCGCSTDGMVWPTVVAFGLFAMLRRRSWRVR